MVRGIVVLGLACLGVVGMAPAAQAQGVPARTAMLRLRVADVAAVGLAGFTGVAGEVSAKPPRQTSTWDGGDPAGVLGFVSGWYGTSAGPGAGTASVDDSVSARDASASWAGIGVRLRSGSGRNVLSVGSLHTYARCTAKPLSDSQQAYAASDANTLYLFDSVVRPLAEGTQTVRTTGGELGLASVGGATLTITVRRVQETGTLWAHAMVEVSVDAVLLDKAGALLYSGRLLDVDLGHVTVDCRSAAPPTTTTTTSTTTTTTTATTPAVVPSGEDSLASTGFRTGPFVGVGLLLILAGGALLLVRRSRRVR